MANYSICTQTFDVGDEPKAKALKPLEEAAEVFGAWQNRYDETRPQDRAHTYLKEHRVCRGYDDTAMERAAQDMIERAYTVVRMESSKAVARETARIIAEGISKELEIDVR